MIKLSKVEIKALEMLSMQNEPLTSDLRKVFGRLVKRGLAEQTTQDYQITETGCDWLSRHAAGSKLPNGDSPCGWIKMS